MGITDVLLYGRLRLDFVKDSRAQSVAILFNTVTYELYQEAVQTLLNSMDGCCQSVDDESRNVSAALKTFLTQISKRDSKISAGRQQVLAFVHWPAAVERAGAPEGVLVLTNNQLLLISEEKARWRRKSKGRRQIRLRHHLLSSVAGRSRAVERVWSI